MPAGSTLASAVGTCVWVPTTAVTRPSRCQPIATFSEVASACMSTSTWSASLSSPSATSTSLKAGRPARRYRFPLRFTTPRRTPSRSTITAPRPGWVRRKLAGLRIGLPALRYG